MFQLVNMKPLCRMLIVLLVLQMSPAWAWAQPNQGTAKPSQPQPTPTAKPADTTQKPPAAEPVERATQPASEKPVRLVPERVLPGTLPPASTTPEPQGVEPPWPWYGDDKEGYWQWEHPGVDPVMPMSEIPGWGKSEEGDRQILRSIVLKEKGFEENTRLYEADIKLNLFDGKDPDQFFIEDMRLISHNLQFVKRPVSNGTTLRCRMSMGLHTQDGRRGVKLSPRLAQVASDNVGDVYATPGILMRSGPYKGHMVSILWFQCGNRSCTDATAAAADSEATALTAVKDQTTEFVFHKDRRIIKDGKDKADKVPGMDVERFSVVLKPLDGGPEIIAPSLDNKTARAKVVKGRKYEATERYNENLYEAEQASVLVQAGDVVKDNAHTFRNFRKPERKPEQTAGCVGANCKGPKGEPGPRGPKGDDGKGMSKLEKGILIGVLAFGATCGAGLGGFCRKEKTVTNINVIPPGKGTTSNGGSAGMSFMISVPLK